jgi:hydrogenase-4 membrane subunit HyfE
MALTAVPAHRVREGDVIQLFNDQYIVTGVLTIVFREDTTTLYLTEKLPNDADYTAREATLTVNTETEIHLYSM